MKNLILITCEKPGETPSFFVWVEENDFGNNIIILASKNHNKKLKKDYVYMKGAFKDIVSLKERIQSLIHFSTKDVLDFFNHLLDSFIDIKEENLYSSEKIKEELKDSIFIK